MSSKTNQLGAYLLGFLITSLVTEVCGQPSVQQDAPKQRNGSSQRYEINQTFDGQAFEKDNNIWVYTKEFADLYGMPAKHIEDIKGVAAAAFRIEESAIQRCGYGGKVENCQKIEQCSIDLYFDESKTPLPWVPGSKSQWVPYSASMRWLRPTDTKERPNGVLAVDPPTSVVRNSVVRSALVPFYDVKSGRQAIFTSNAWDATGDSEAVTGSLAILGFTRDFYNSLSVVSLQFRCSTIPRFTVDIRLDAKEEVYGKPIAAFNRIGVPEKFVQRINAELQALRSRNEAYFQRLFGVPPGDKPSK